MWIRCNPNPKGKEVPDCVVRAIAIALDMKWYDVYDDLCSIGRDECNMPSADSVWGKYLYLQGFEPFLLSSACSRCITIAEFCRYYPLGVYIIGTGSHAVAVIDGNYYDNWNSGMETPTFFWKVR